jgi:tRNA(Arg) A34 adenosine deaminase TadA
MARWNELDRYDRPWIDVFVLMWEAYVAGTIPVGAVIADESGRVVARGRNRIFDSPAGGELGGSRLAHAEVNALLALSSAETSSAARSTRRSSPAICACPRRSRPASGR